jgi:hypothetical protein
VLCASVSAVSATVTLSAETASAPVAAGVCRAAKAGASATGPGRYRIACREHSVKAPHLDSRAWQLVTSPGRGSRCAAGSVTGGIAAEICGLRLLNIGPAAGAESQSTDHRLKDKPKSAVC